MIESEYIDPLTVKLDKVEEMQSRMRGLASAVKNLQEYDEWNISSRESGVPWGQLTAAQSATGGIHQVGHIGLNPNVYTTNSPYQNLNTITGTSVNSLIGSSATDYNMKVEQSGQIDIKGEKADIRINGKSMNKWMEQVEQRLNILSPNPELEKEWDDLRRLGERYRKLEKKCQEKAKMWEALKKLPKVKP
jgi:hypothetical protein